MVLNNLQSVIGLLEAFADCKFAGTAAERRKGCSPLYGTQVTHPDSTFGCCKRGNSVGRTTWWQTMYRSAPLVPKGFSRIVPGSRFLSLLSIVFTPQSVFLRPFPGIAFSFLTVRSSQTDADPFLCNLKPQTVLFVILG